MECQFAFICDFAEQDGKLHALGVGWNMIIAQNLPVIHPVMSLVAKLTGSVAEAGTKEIVLRLIDVDGMDVMPELRKEGPFEVSPPKLEGAMQLIFNLNGLEFSKYGAYAFHLLVNGNELARVPFTVTQPPSTT